MKHLFWFFAIIVVFGVIVGFELNHYGKNLDTSIIAAPPSGMLTLDGVRLSVYIADTPAKQELGLGQRDSLPQDQGMLFVFPQDGLYPFWMKDMHFSIDMLWLDDNGTIVTIAPNVSPSTYPQTFSPSKPSRYVLEVNAGFADTNQVHIGDIVHFNQ